MMQGNPQRSLITNSKEDPIFWFSLKITVNRWFFSPHGDIPSAFIGDNGKIRESPVSYMMKIR